MPNVIEHAAVFQTELDKAAREQATSGWMEPNESLIKYTGGDEVKIPSLDMDGLGDYVRNEGAPEGSVSLTYETKKMTMDRGRLFTFDEHEVDESNFLMTASNVVGEFQRNHVLPEIDAYRYSYIAAKAMEKSQHTEYTPAESTVLQKLYYDIAAVQDVAGEVPLVISISTMVLAMLGMSDKLSKKLDVTEFTQGDATFKVKSLDGQHPLIGVGSGKLMTGFEFLDGKTAGQEKGGFKPATDAKKINWLICPQKTPIAVSRTDKVRIFDPETYQKMRSWAMDYRRFHDIWITKNKLPAVRVSVQ